MSMMLEIDSPDKEHEDRVGCFRFNSAWVLKPEAEVGVPRLNAAGLFEPEMRSKAEAERMMPIQALAHLD